MGNNNSICPAEKYNESIECPICLENHSKYITLECGHKFDYYCIQMHLFSKYSIDADINCPYCRSDISKKLKKLIWRKWLILNYKADAYSTNYILNINNNLKCTHINDIEYTTDVSYNTIFMPLFHGKPAFLISPVINDSNVLYKDKVIELSHLFSFYKTDYGETIDKYNFILDCYITDKKWHKFLSKICKSFNIETNTNLDYLNKVNYSEYKMRFYINDINNITTIDNYNGKYYNELHYFKNRKFKCIFKMYFVKNEFDFYLINELHSIIY